jgi:hypothetical protein
MECLRPQISGWVFVVVLLVAAISNTPLGDLF